LPAVWAAHNTLKVCKSFDEPLIVDGRHIQVGLRIGYASNTLSNCGVEDMLRHAVILLEDAKAVGLSYVDYDESRLVQSYDWQLESELNQAIANNKLVLFFQPKISLKRQGKIYLEALARWQHPERGMISPMAFIPLAEQSGAIKPLTKWAIHSALRSLTEWPGFVSRDNDDHTDHYSVAVNLSVHALEGDGFVDLVSAALNIWGSAPRI
jgi:predicted signal transduction protein with EAL and GGDEF domain